jgi:hypothetical protein
MKHRYTEYEILYLKFIVDILYDYDGCNTVKSLKELIDEAREEAIKGVNQKENYGK